MPVREFEIDSHRIPTVVRFTALIWIVTGVMVLSIVGWEYIEHGMFSRDREEIFIFSKLLFVLTSFAMGIQTWRGAAGSLRRVGVASIVFSICMYLFIVIEFISMDSRIGRSRELAYFVSLSPMVLQGFALSLAGAMACLNARTYAEWRRERNVNEMDTRSNASRSKDKHPTRLPRSSCIAASMWLVAGVLTAAWSTYHIGLNAYYGDEPECHVFLLDAISLVYLTFGVKVSRSGSSDVTGLAICSIVASYFAAYWASDYAISIERLSWINQHTSQQKLEHYEALEFMLFFNSIFWNVAGISALAGRRAYAAWSEFHRLGALGEL